MRLAKALDWQRRLTSKTDAWTNRLVRFAASEVPSIGTIEFPLFVPLTIISGPNGTGKSTLLRALWSCLDAAAAAKAIARDSKLHTGRILVDVSIGGTTSSFEVSLSPDGIKASSAFGVSVAYIDAASTSSLYREKFVEFVNTEELTNGVLGRAIKDAELAEVSSIIGRDYRHLTVYEVEVGEYAPFFEASYGNDKYDSRTMGAGELAALHLWWAIKRLETDSFVLIEEPETFLSYSSQVSLSHFLAEMIVRKRLSAVICTHSPSLMSFMPPQSLMFLSRGQSGLKVAGSNPHPSLLKSLGINPPISSALLVEDYAAKFFCQSLLERFSPSLARTTVINVRGGESHITSALVASKQLDIPFLIRGVFDGDFASQIPLGVADVSTYLPGNMSIEKTFREMVVSDPAKLQSATGFSDLHVLLDTLEGSDSHDWFEGVAKELGFSKEQLFPFLFGIWVDIGENEAEAKAAFVRIAAVLGIQAIVEDESGTAA